MKTLIEKSWTSTDFLDANIFVYAFTKVDLAKRDACRSLLLRAEGGKESFVTDYLALVEAFQHVSRLATKAEAQGAFRQLLSLEGFSLVPLGNTLFFEAMKSYTSSSLQFADHVHFTTAKMSAAQHIFSYDKDFDNLDIRRVEP